MKTKSPLYLGLMSGTSLDGIDAVAVRFIEQGNAYQYELLHAKTYGYSPKWQASLANAIQLDSSALEELNQHYTQYLADIVRQFMREYQIPAQEVAAVCSHGHTVFHQPEKAYTLQIGNLPQLAQLLGVCVVCDFRVQDVRLGGQGAPLVPVGDALLFGEYDACINLGGFANISYDQGNRRIAYDICPLNILLNRYADQLGLAYDEEGRLAAKGAFDETLFDALQNIAYYQSLPPKSLGLEWVNAVCQPILSKFDLSATSMLRTLTEHMAHQLAAVVLPEQRILLTGGGALNRFLIARFRALSDAQLILPKDELIHFKEALVFAFLGMLRLSGLNNVYASVTGASRDHSSGVIFHP
ncbi:anhydro-N-acetylmuramic acid kinase [Mesonia sp. HuA40]|uniref:anhydro-N-acetylmuramic acid kinase n=1 Tax=Mesonia sp. HuA40 TaxID=2602761 RepID=UPI0011CC2B7C|nr:anhydro-N-acetylmuramic acid kinase [Mesonia sp. HuA40]TXK74036.1 anhydro-N-acetylmuramic acid kinase [Mesonia sp. HuA40]